MTPKDEDNTICSGCRKLARHCTCGRYAKKSRHFNEKGEKVVDESTEEFKGKVKDTIIKGGISLGHDLLDTFGDEFITDKSKAKAAKGSKKVKDKAEGGVKQQCYFCKKFVDDLSEHTCDEKDAQVVEAEFEVVDGQKKKSPPKNEETKAQEDKDGTEKE